MWNGNSEPKLRESKTYFLGISFYFIYVLNINPWPLDPAISPDLQSADWAIRPNAPEEDALLTKVAKWISIAGTRLWYLLRYMTKRGKSWSWSVMTRLPSPLAVGANLLAVVSVWPADSWDDVLSLGQDLKRRSLLIAVPQADVGELSWCQCITRFSVGLSPKNYTNGFFLKPLQLYLKLS